MRLRMKTSLVIFLSSVLLILASCQECRLVPVCDNSASSGIPALIKGDKGDQGVSGKAGPEGSSIEGVKGEKGEQGEVQELDQFMEQLNIRLTNLETLLTPASCLTSSVYGRQTLRSGEEAFCDGGWTVFQRRFDGSLNFDKNWEQYQGGFGSMDGEFWLGLEKVHLLTRNRGCKLRVDLWDFNDEQAYAIYNMFVLESETDMYRLHVSGYMGNAGDSLMDDEERHDGQPFTTKDRDNDEYDAGNCATFNSNRSGGWWFYSCFRASLNAPWGRSTGTWHNIIWNSWKGSNEALKATTMKFRCD